MPTKATPSVPAVVHELPVTAPTTRADRRRRRRRRSPARSSAIAVGHDRGDRAGHVPGADQRPDGEEDEDRPHRRRAPRRSPRRGARRRCSRSCSATSPANTALVNSATWSGPSAASIPNRTIVSVEQHDQRRRPGSSASRRLGCPGVAWRPGSPSARTPSDIAASPSVASTDDSGDVLRIAVRGRRRRGRCGPRRAGRRRRAPRSTPITQRTRVCVDACAASYTGSRSSGQVMQCPPPRPLPSSKPAISITSTPAWRILAIV